jgi:tetratricopeptide (TPR) repeat protein
VCAVALCPACSAQEFPSEAARLSAAQNAFDAGRWEDAARLAHGPADQAPALDLLAGLAFAKLQRWPDARSALEVGRRKAPTDARFLVELAGVDYRQRDFRSAKRELRAALRLDGHDAYALEFLGTLYFLEGNLEAALKYWNRIDKPRLRNVSVQPRPHIDAVLLDRAIGFNAPQVLTGEALLGAEARIENLGIFPSQRMELTPADNGNYQATLHLTERGSWRNSPAAGVISLLSGLPYSTVYPEFYNVGGKAANVTSLLRWDSEKRRAFVAVSTPIFRNPSRRFRAYADARNENWNLTNTFFGGGLALGNLNLRRTTVGAEFRSIINERWNWSGGIEVANRSFRNLAGHTSEAERAFFTGGVSFTYWLRAERFLLRWPERRLTINSSAGARIGREFADNVGASGALRGSLHTRWFPRSASDDYEVQLQLRAGSILGRVPFDQLFQLGVERDNDLWLRGHSGSVGGRKGAAPLGRRFFLANWEMDKDIYHHGFFSVKLGPFVDTGTIADSSGLFGSQRWLWDVGAQCKIRVLGGLNITLSYGRDLRGGRGVFYGTVLH